MKRTPLPLDAAALDRWSALLARIIDHSDGTRPFAEVYDDELEPFIAQSRAALTLAARVAELEALAAHPAASLAAHDAEVLERAAKACRPDDDCEYKCGTRHAARIRALAAQAQEVKS